MLRPTSLLRFSQEPSRVGLSNPISNTLPKLLEASFEVLIEEAGMLSDVF